MKPKIGRPKGSKNKPQKRKYTRKQIVSQIELPFKVIIEDTEIKRSKYSPVYEGLKQHINSLDKGKGFVYPKKYHGSVQGIVSKLNKEWKGSHAYGTSRVNQDTRKVGRIL